jgi:spoIIIJ-associated protein
MKDEIRAFVERITDAAGFELDVTVDEGDGEEAFHVVLSGPDRGLLLGRGAELLDAIEYVTNRAFGKRMGHDEKIVFDSGNYRSVRAHELRMMAEKAAERVRSSRTAFIFEPMTPSERRIIHLALVEDGSVRTESVGDGFERKVKVLPA